MKTKLLISIEGLPSTPSLPLKGRGHKRVEWRYAHTNSTAKAAWEAIPIAHKTTLLQYSGKGFFTPSRSVSPEAAKALKGILKNL